MDPVDQAHVVHEACVVDRVHRVDDDSTVAVPARCAATAPTAAVAAVPLTVRALRTRGMETTATVAPHWLGRPRGRPARRTAARPSRRPVRGVRAGRTGARGTADAAAGRRLRTRTRYGPVRW
ncbi:hypothetical protein ACIRD2_07130 [Streptomyces sp. NPDC093595]|uniref:hypothetical protein n=1 Tax=Streptomyces sp. NPDC093595 TaxID=3366045 RepID=UPI00380884B3